MLNVLPLFSLISCGSKDTVSEEATVIEGVDGKDGRDGINGSNGTNGTNGITTVFDAQEEPAGVNCEFGGTAITYGFDLNYNGLLDVGEAVSVFYLCNGANGESPEGITNYWGGDSESPFTYNGDVSFTQFGDMLAFCQSYNAIDGNLTISSTLLTETNDLECIEAIRGDLRIESNSRLEEIRFANLRILGGDIVIQNNAQLEIIEFDRLEIIDKSYIVQSNEILHTIRMPYLSFVGFDFLQEGHFTLSQNPALTILDAEKLQVIQNDFIMDNNGFVDIDGLDLLRHVGGNFSVSNNAVLETFSSLSTFERVGNHLNFSQNPSLLNVDGFSKLFFVGGSIDMQGHELLQSFNLPMLRYVGHADGIYIGYNPLLQVLLTPALDTIYGRYVVEYNDSLSVIDIAFLEESTDQISITNNALLVGIDLSSLVDANEILISNNAVLSQFSLPSLDVATKIQIDNNVALTAIDMSSLHTLRRQVSVSEHPLLISVDMTALTTLEHQNWFGEYYIILTFLNNPQFSVDQTFYDSVILNSLGNTCESFGYTCTQYSGNL